jgi:hypothetical protein
MLKVAQQKQQSKTEAREAGVNAERFLLLYSLFLFVVASNRFVISFRDFHAPSRKNRANNNIENRSDYSLIFQ